MVRVTFVDEVANVLEWLALLPEPVLVVDQAHAVLRAGEGAVPRLLLVHAVVAGQAQTAYEYVQRNIFDVQMIWASLKSPHAYEYLVSTRPKGKA